MRVFVALDLTEEVRQRITEFAREMRARAPRARWTRIEGIHVTLKFIGEVAPGRAEAIRVSLEPVRTTAPVTLRFQGAGFFPNDRQPRVFWAGVLGPPELAELAAEIERRLEPLGIPRETRPFQPHLTLARFEQPRESGDLRRALAEIGGREFGSIVTDEFHLYESRLGTGGARYARLASFHFAPETP